MFKLAFNNNDRTNELNINNNHILLDNDITLYNS